MQSAVVLTIAIICVVYHGRFINCFYSKLVGSVFSLSSFWNYMIWLQLHSHELVCNYICMDLFFSFKIGACISMIFVQFLYLMQGLFWFILFIYF